MHRNERRVSEHCEERAIDVAVEGIEALKELAFDRKTYYATWESIIYTYERAFNPVYADQSDSQGRVLVWLISFDRF